jgi:hypothetical protein
VDLLHYIQDGGMLSAQLTRSMTLQMVTYNPAAVVFGYFSATFTCVIGVAFAVVAVGEVEFAGLLATTLTSTITFLSHVPLGGSTQESSP